MAFSNTGLVHFHNDLGVSGLITQNGDLLKLKHAYRGISWFRGAVDIFPGLCYEGISKSFEPNMERARNLDLFCFIFQRSPLPTPHTCPI